MVDMVVDTVMVDMVVDMEDTAVDTMAAKREKPMLTQMPKLMPMPHPIIMVDTTAEDTDMVVMDTDIPIEDTDTEDTEVMVDTVMADIMVEKFYQDQVTR